MGGAGGSLRPACLGLPHGKESRYQKGSRTLARPVQEAVSAASTALPSISILFPKEAVQQEACAPPIFARALPGEKIPG